MAQLLGFPFRPLARAERACAHTRPTLRRVAVGVRKCRNIPYICTYIFLPILRHCNLHFSIYLHFAFRCVVCRTRRSQLVKIYASCYIYIGNHTYKMYRGRAPAAVSRPSQPERQSVYESFCFFHLGFGLTSGLYKRKIGR